jgi:hypothetical protein
MSAVRFASLVLSGSGGSEPWNCDVKGQKTPLAAAGGLQQMLDPAMNMNFHELQGRQIAGEEMHSEL